MKEIDLTKGKIALVDDEDFEYLNQWKWHVNHNGYAIRQLSKKESPNIRQRLFMHHAILPRNDLVIDHIDGNKVNNQKSNLRYASVLNNTRNQTIRKDSSCGYKGVYFSLQKNKWHARIKTSTKRLHLGFFDSSKEAAKAYNQAAIKYFGQFANLNKI